MRANARLTEEQLADAREAFTLLDGSGITLASAARIALRLDDQPRAAKGVLIADAIDRFCLEAMRRKRREKTLTGYRQQLDQFERDHHDAALDSISRPDLRRYLLGLKLKPASIAVRWRCVRALYRWARRQEPPLCSTDPTAGLALDLPHAEHELVVLPVADCSAIMHGVSPRWRPAAALALFAGIRPQELSGFGKARLSWESIDMAGKIIRVPASVAKTRRERIIEGLPPTVWDWLATVPEAARKGPVCTGSHQGFIGAVKAASGRGKGKRKWPQDGTRHAFASYAVALNSDPGRVSLWLGHQGRPELLLTRYRALATEAQAKGFFGILPQG